MKFLFFRASWCGPCNQMAPAVYDTFHNSSLKDLFTHETIDIDEQPEYAAKMDIRGVPTCVILDDNGKERSRRVGAMPKRKLVEWLEWDFNSNLKLAVRAPLVMLTSAIAPKCKINS